MGNFRVIKGQFGVGKKTRAKQIANELGYQFSFIGNKVDDIRELIKNCYTVNHNMVYCIADGDALTIQAQNSLLKIGEEPPKSSIIIVCVEMLESLLPTIISRANVITLNNPTKKDLQLYTQKKINASHKGNFEEIAGICDTYGEIDLILQYDVTELISFSNKVIDNILRVNTPNAFKMLSYLKVKETDSDDKYDVKIFLKTMLNILSSRMDEIPKMNNTLNKYIHLYQNTNVLLHSINKNVNVGQMLDYWLLNVRVMEAL